MSSIKKLESIVKLNNLYVARSSFSRLTDEIQNYNLQIGFQKNVYSDSGGGYKVELVAVIENEAKEFIVEVELVGMFSIDSDDVNLKDILINNNAVAIMFPYIRSQVSTLTSGPGFTPIVIPPINISSLLSDEPEI